MRCETRSSLFRNAEHHAVIAIGNGEILVGDLPTRALKLVAEWADLHRGELETDWVRTKGGSGDGGNRTRVRGRVSMASTSVAGSLISSHARLAGRVV
jgi:hypothetical protein